MYSRPDIVPSSRSNIRRKRNLPVLLAILCVALTLFLIASVIVLGLIPVYLGSKSVTVNPNTLTSKEVTMIIETQANPNSRRKRSPGDLSAYVGGDLGETAIDQIQQKLLANMPSTIVSGLSIVQASLGYKGDRRRKRFGLRRNRRYTSNTIVIVIRMYIIFVPSCLYSCQLYKGPILQQVLYSITLTTFIFYNVPIYQNGVFYGYAPQIEFITVDYVSAILPSLSPATVGSSPATASTSTTTTTTTIATAAIG